MISTAVGAGFIPSDIALRRCCAPPPRCRITILLGLGAMKKSTTRCVALSTPAPGIRGKCAVPWLDDDPNVEAERAKYREASKPVGKATARARQIDPELQAKAEQAPDISQ